MKRIFRYISEKFQELKGNDEYQLASLFGFTFGVLFVFIIYNL